MPIPESEIREATLRVLARTPGGFMTTTDLIQVLMDVLKPTGSDLEILEGRSDTRFSQKVRNLASHREASTSLESRGHATYSDVREGWQIIDAGRAYVAARYP